VPESADFVMYWWNQAALSLRIDNTNTASPHHRFGFITTNSVSQAYGRQVVAQYLDSANPLSIVWAIPDHPWIDSETGASVRIAMTVVAKGKTHGKLVTVVREGSADSLVLNEQVGTIAPSLTLGVSPSSATPLLANKELSFMGVTLGGQGFVLGASDPL